MNSGIDSTPSTPSNTNSNQILSPEDQNRLSNTRKRLFILVAAITSLYGIIIPFSGTEIRTIFTNLPETISAGLVLVLSIAFLLFHIRLRNRNGEKGKTSLPLLLTRQRPLLSAPYEVKIHIPFTIGIGLWFAAELIYSYYQIGLRVKVPFPSIADPMYLLGYGFFAYSFYKMLRYLRQSVDREVIVFASATVCVSLSFILYISMGVEQTIVPLGDQLTTALSAAYPVLDGVLFVPSLAILWSVKRSAIQENLIYSYWIFISIFIILNTIGDIGYGYNAISGSLYDSQWIWNIFFYGAYITISAAVFWQIRYHQFISKHIQIMEKNA